MANNWCPCLMFVWSWFIPNSCLLNSVTPVKVPKKLPLYIYIWAQKIIWSWEETKKTWAPVGVVVIDHEGEKVADEQFIRLAELTKVV